MHTATLQGPATPRVSASTTAAHADHETFLAIQRTAELLAADLGALLKARGTSFTQYNVLRILREVGEQGLPVLEVGQRMVAREPDVSRLVERMARLGLVERERGTRDRRQVYCRLTQRGRLLVDSLDEPVATLHRQQLGMLSPARAVELHDTLAAIRSRLGDPKPGA